MSELPRITVITPNFNQGRYLERTICSVLDQGYENLEYAVMDGGSCDESIEILRSYEDDLDWWISKDDDGPADAMNTALDYATGEIIACLHSDDLYLPFTLQRVAHRMRQPDRPQWLVGGCREIDEHDRILDHPQHRAPEDLGQYLRSRSRFGGLPQPATFYRAELLRRIGGFERMLHHRYAFEFHCRLLSRGLAPTVLPEALAAHRTHPDSMSRRDPMTSREEHHSVLNCYAQAARAATQEAGRRHAA